MIRLAISRTIRSVRLSSFSVVAGLTGCLEKRSSRCGDLPSEPDQLDDDSRIGKRAELLERLDRTGNLVHGVRSW